MTVDEWLCQTHTEQSAGWATRQPHHSCLPHSEKYFVKAKLTQAEDALTRALSKQSLQRPSSLSAATSVPMWWSRPGGTPPGRQAWLRYVSVFQPSGIILMKSRSVIPWKGTNVAVTLTPDLSCMAPFVLVSQACYSSCHIHIEEGSSSLLLIHRVRPVPRRQSPKAGSSLWGCQPLEHAGWQKDSSVLGTHLPHSVPWTHLHPLLPACKDVMNVVCQGRSRLGSSSDKSLKKIIPYVTYSPPYDQKHVPNQNAGILHYIGGLLLVTCQGTNAFSPRLRGCLSSHRTAHAFTY